MRIMSFNANGIRSAGRKGFFEWLDTQAIDIVCVQETKAQVDQLSDELYHPKGYYCHYHDAEKKGYSGVAIYSKQEPLEIVEGCGVDWIDIEGRYLEFVYPNVSVISLYLPSGSSGDLRQQYKYRLLDWFSLHLNKLARKKREFILCGDWNIAHTKADIRNWSGNQKSSGFMPLERAWMTQLLNEQGYVDAFREIEQPEHSYTWWSNRGQAFANNVGWRIDYQITTGGLKGKVIASEIETENRFSDHAPLTIEYDFSIK